MASRAARKAILEAAEAHRLSLPLGLRLLRKPYTARHLQRAVHLCRRYTLVEDATLIAAGFTPTPKTPEQQHKHDQLVYLRELEQEWGISDPDPA